MGSSKAEASRQEAIDPADIVRALIGLHAEGTALALHEGGLRALRDGGRFIAKSQRCEGRGHRAARRRLSGMAAPGWAKR